MWLQVFSLNTVQIESSTFNLHEISTIYACKLKVLLSICTAIRYNKRHDQA